MALSISRLAFSVFRHKSRIPVPRKSHALACPNRSLHTTPLYRLQEEDSSNSDSSKPTRQPFVFSLSDLDSEEVAVYESLSPEDREQWREEAQQMHDHMTSPAVESELQGEVSRAVHETAEEVPSERIVVERIKQGLFSMGEDEEQDSGEDEEFEADDITSLGHGELEQHREMRHYARIAAWEMPLLSSMPYPLSSIHAPPS